MLNVGSYDLASLHHLKTKTIAHVRLVNQIVFGYFDVYFALYISIKSDTKLHRKSQ